MASTRTLRTRAANDAARAALAAAAAAPATDHIGDLAWWDLDSDFRRDVDQVRERFVAFGLDPDAILPASPSWFTAFSRAVASVRASVHAQGYTLLDAAKGPNGEKRVAIVHVSRNGRVTTDDQGTVVCPVDGSSPYVERPDPAGIVHDVLAKARELFAVYTGDDIRVGIQRVFARWAALPCRVAPPHIVYWLPPAAGEEVRKLADVCDDLGVGRIELFAGSRQDGRSVRAVTTAVNQGLEARLNDFAAEVQRYADADPTKTRVSTMEEKLAEAVRLRQQGEMYRAVLGLAVQSIDERMGLIEAQLRDTLGLVQAAKPAA